ncbi:MAG: hypothetical protein H6850_01410 [Alphaproteobacteria bacterium]|nr:MAG: hypothetical protein H6850_01410 [Alphaproteobacteria bacterium]
MKYEKRYAERKTWADYLTMALSISFVYCVLDYLYLKAGSNKSIHEDFVDFVKTGPFSLLLFTAIPAMKLVLEGFNVFYKESSDVYELRIRIKSLKELL